MHISNVRSICGAHHGSNINRKVRVTKRNQVEQLWLNIKNWSWEVWQSLMSVWKKLWMGRPQTVPIDRILLQSEYCMKVVHTNWNEYFVFLHPKNGNTRMIFVHDFWLRSLKSLFDWGHLFVICVARGKFCKSRKFRFWSFPEVITIWRIQC